VYSAALRIFLLPAFIGQLAPRVAGRCLSLEQRPFLASGHSAFAVSGICQK